MRIRKTITATTAALLLLAGCSNSEPTLEAQPPRVTASTVVPDNSSDLDPTEPVGGGAYEGLLAPAGDPAFDAVMDHLYTAWPTEAAAAGRHWLEQGVREGCEALSRADGQWGVAASRVVDALIERGIPIGFGAYVVGAGATLYCPENMEVVPFLETAVTEALATDAE